MEATNSKTNKDVIAPATLVESEYGRLWRVEVCPFCSYVHTHAGGYPWDDPRDWLGPRTTWCTGEARIYRLVDGEGAT
jgi:hypothetical protein